MFTGIIHGQGDVLTVKTGQKETWLLVQARYELAALVIGESIAVNGACLTVESGANGRFSAYASAETMRCTALGALTPGSRVNLERALAVGDRLGGHLVSGHVDCVAHVLSVRQEGESRRIRIGFSETLAPEVIPKGSVALDGVSLTVNDCGTDFLDVNVIPETWRVTTVATWTQGTRINMETDIIGKYGRRMLAPFRDPGSPQNQAGEKTGQASGVSLDFLHDNGFF
ncbi:MAG: riboflavin synthase [Bilophila sp.]